MPLPYIDCVISFFSLPLHHIGSAAVSTNLHNSVYNHININYIIFFSPSQHNHSKLDNFKIHFVNNEFKKNKLDFN
jgi:hypothetical protein